MQPTGNTLSEKIRTQPIELLDTHPAAMIDPHAQVKAPRADRLYTSTDGRRTASEFNDRIGAWVNEGGAGETK